MLIIMQTISKNNGPEAIKKKIRDGLFSFNRVIGIQLGYQKIDSFRLMSPREFIPIKTIVLLPTTCLSVYLKL